MKKFKHSLSNYRLLTTDMGKLVPIGLWEVLPTDEIQGKTNLLIRLSPMTAPVMHPVTAEVFNMFVPARLVWNKELDGSTDWETFITGGALGDDASTPPTITTTGTKGDVLDYFGLPLVAGKEINALPVRAFNLCFNDWFRDQDLVDERALDDLSIPLAAWKRDYFTTARPWTQKGPNVTLPIGTRAPIRTEAGTGVDLSMSNALGTRYVANTGNPALQLGAPGGNKTNELFADLADIDGANVNDVRRAYAIQRFQEARAAWGSRYVEYLKSIGANPADARLQRPEIVSHGSAKVSISEVLQTAPETGEDQYGVGDMYGHGIAAMRSNRFRRTFQEHGYLISMMVVRPRTLYQDGIDRLWLKKDKEDFFQRELQFIGQQNVYQDEIYADVANTDQDIFGYQDRYREYRETPSKVSGDFRDTLDFWHLGRKFASSPALNEQFINCDATKRIFNVQGEDTLWIAAQHRVVARRQVAKNAVGRIL